MCTGVPISSTTFPTNSSPRSDLPLFRCSRVGAPTGNRRSLPLPLNKPHQSHPQYLTRKPHPCTELFFYVPTLCRDIPAACLCSCCHGTFRQWLKGFSHNNQQIPLPEWLISCRTLVVSSRYLPFQRFHVCHRLCYQVALLKPTRSLEPGLLSFPFLFLNSSSLRSHFLFLLGKNCFFFGMK